MERSDIAVFFCSDRRAIDELTPPRDYTVPRQTLTGQNICSMMREASDRGCVIAVPVSLRWSHSNPPFSDPFP